jgi:hypothetical protein
MIKSCLVYVLTTTWWREWDTRSSRFHNIYDFKLLLFVYGVRSTKSTSDPTVASSPKFDLFSTKILEDLRQIETANVLTTLTSRCYDWPPTFISRIRHFFEQRLLHLDQLGVLMIGKWRFTLVLWYQVTGTVVVLVLVLRSIDVWGGGGGISGTRQSWNADVRENCA